MPKRLLAGMIAAGLGLFSCSVANAQVVDKILMHAVSWILQKQIEQLANANDPNRSLSEYDPKDGYSSAGGGFDPGNSYAPRLDAGYSNMPRQEGAQFVVPTSQ